MTMQISLDIFLIKIVSLLLANRFAMQTCNCKRQFMIEDRRKIEFAARVVSGFRGVPLMLFGLAFVVSTILNYAAELGAQSSYGKDLTFSLTFMLGCAAFALIVYP